MNKLILMEQSGRSPHIATDVHDYVTLWTSGHKGKRNDNNVIIIDFELLNENQFPVTYKTCFILWLTAWPLKINDVKSEEQKSILTDTILSNVTLWASYIH